MITIRQATPKDAPALAMLNAAFNGVHDPAEAIAERMAKAGDLETAFIARVDGDVAGFACLRIAPSVLYAQPHAELTELFVLPQFRRRGAARALVMAAQQLARQRGAESLIALTNPSNTPAQAFYAALGYQKDDVSFEKML